MDELFIIMVDYFHGDADGNEWTETAVLGVEKKGSINIIVFDEELCPRTKVFKGERDAMAYVKELNLNDSFCYENLRIVPLTNTF